MSLPERDAYTDVVELCALLQCLGYNVRSLDTSDGNLSQDGAKTVIVNCQASGLNVVLENGSAACSCPATNLNQNSGFWQVSAVSGGKQLNKETGSSLLGSLPKSTKERLARDLQEIVKTIKEHNETIGNDSKTGAVTDSVNRSASMAELNTTPDKVHLQIKADTPTRYRSLDTLMNAKETVTQLPPPGSLVKTVEANASVDDVRFDNQPLMCRRQSTYTVASTPSSVRRRNKTSSPIENRQNSLLENLLDAEKSAEHLKNLLAVIINDFAEEGKHNSSISSLALDVSKISLLKGADSKAQFASSPNLSALGTVHEDKITKTKLRRFESISTSSLASKSTPKEGGGSKIVSKLRRLSPSIFKVNKDSPNQSKTDKNTKTEGRTPKINGIPRARIATPVRIPKLVPEDKPNLSSSKKKFSHVKSTIPRPTSKKD